MSSSPSPNPSSNSKPSKKSTPSEDLKRLVRKELGLPPKESEGDSVEFDTTDLDSGQPRVKNMNKPLVGLALSGGGIRSAAFNLGILQGLNYRRLLGYINYLSTVSGGGYVGGFWMAWLQRIITPGSSPGGSGSGPTRGKDDREWFPESDDFESEDESVRCLRGRANYLLPSSGMVGRDTADLVANAGAMILASLVFVNSLLLIIVLAAHGLIYLFEFGASLPGSQSEAVAVEMGLVDLMTKLWSNSMSKLQEVLPFMKGLYLPSALLFLRFVGGILGSLGSGIARLIRKQPFGFKFPFPYLILSVAWLVAAVAVQAKLPEAIGDAIFFLFPGVCDLGPYFWLYVIALGFFAIMIATRVVTYAVVSIFRNHDRSPNKVGKVEAIGWRYSWFSLLMVLGFSLGQVSTGDGKFPAIVGIELGTLAILTYLYLRLRRWLVAAFSLYREPTFSFLSKLLFFMVRCLPVAIIFLNVTLLTVVVNMAHMWWDVDMLYIFFGALIVFVVSIYLFDPNVLSLHPIFRDRIHEAFVECGFCEGGSCEGRVTKKSRTLDKSRMEGIKIQKAYAAPFEQGSGPFHLVCCTVSDCHVDELDGISEGGKSAVISRYGIWADRAYYHWRKNGSFSIAGALATSAAAVNSLMGSYSRKLGAAMSFVAASLNLRLGRWVDLGGMSREWFDGYGKLKGEGARRSASSGFRWPILPGALFLKELFSTAKAKDKVVHLSDGGHFDNLGLYELVRREVLYIIVSEAGEDPAAATRYFGETIRKVRSDFGVDIEIDVSVLEPNDNGRTRQHLAVGKIKYSKYKHGVLIYLRTGLTGDEPVDVLNYHNENPAFPYESTVDQFFSAGQWEAYRALGYHTAFEVFRFVDEDLRKGRAGGNTTGVSQPGPSQSSSRGRGEDVLSPSRVFAEAQWRWDIVPVDTYEALKRVNKRQEEFIDEVVSKMPPTLVKQVYPEIKGLAVEEELNSFSTPSERFFWIRKSLIFLESVWRELGVERYYRYPEIKPWMNIIDRWIQVEEVQVLWPALRTYLDSNFVKFLEREQNGALKQSWEIEVRYRERRSKKDDQKEELKPAGFSWFYVAAQAGCKFEAVFLAKTKAQNEVMREALELGEIRDFAISPPTDVNGKKHYEVSWRQEAFEVIPGFRGSGLGSRSLKRLIEELKSQAHRVHGNDWKLMLRVDVAAEDHYGFPENERVRFYQEPGFLFDGDHTMTLELTPED